MGAVPTKDLPLDSIAIIGVAGRFPGASNVRAFWKNLVDCRESIDFFEVEELDPSVTVLATDPNYIRAKGLLDGIEFFDADFFGVSPAEARVLDPQQRTLLELAWTALEDAGYGGDDRPRKVAVYVGTNWNHYATKNLGGNPDLVQRYGAFNIALANESDFPATRLSYKLDLTGPSVSLFTACSTGLVATSEAVQSLLNFECDMALAGGAAISLPQRQGYLYQEGGMLSRDGHTRSFDAKASGTTFNEGAALVLLKRLEDAVADRDHIYAVIRGAATNNDGADKMSFTAPSVKGQAEVIEMALGAANVSADSITFIETHGTATPLGDPIEVEALNQVYARSDSAGASSCVIGSVKSNIGHLIQAAGTAGLIKLALAARHGVIPGTVHFKEPNPGLNLPETRFRVSGKTEPWLPGNRPRRGAVSSFGVGGTNAHVIVEEPPQKSLGDKNHAAQVILLSARHESGLTDLARSMADRLDQEPELDLADVAFTLTTGRRTFERRLAVVGSENPTTAAALRAERTPRKVIGDAREPFGQIVFAFPGQGAQLPGMGSEMYEAHGSFRAAFDECLAEADALLDIDLRSLTVNMGDEEKAAKLLEQTQYTQPALFAVGYALARYLQDLGIKPDVMIGHSIGEFVAATLAGVMTVGEGMRIVIERGRLMQSMPPGGMVAVTASEEEASALGKPFGLTVAAINAPDLTVLAGEITAVQAAMAAFDERKVRCTRLRTSHAFHSPMMEPVLEVLGEVIGEIRLHAPRTPIVSTATGRLLTDDEAVSPAYWQSQVRNPVRFAGALHVVLSRGRSGMVELGPGGTLTSLAQRQTDGNHEFFPALGVRSVSEPESVLLALAGLWATGAEIPWRARFAGQTRSRVSLPTYPFERQRHWVDPPSGDARVSDHAAPHAEASRETVTATTLEFVIEDQLKLMRRQLELLGSPDDGELP